MMTASFSYALTIISNIALSIVRQVQNVSQKAEKSGFLLRKHLKPDMIILYV